ncbi:MAG: helix-turn-helix domain-containing protein [Candidatus Obscuribacterales bacterium]|jgi:AraC family transcriptional regulator of adaptative response / DNA-3-methyladenine glycosylase II|nr:helix-turn-helix domain-containing protein [Candidatus Obscuribacterales bacterium]
MLNEESCYQALMTRDRRFDGLFYIGCKSTGVYCRPVCTVRTPMKKNCSFYRTAAAAECAGFRPCLRCRPEHAPGNALIDSVSTLAAEVLQRIESGEFKGIEETASDLGISDRHLRRVVQAEFGVSPIELLQTHRLLLAKLLLCDSALPITEIAFASGFSSVRQFNSAFKDRYNLNPSNLRKSASTKPADRPIKCELAYRKPLPWSQLMSYLALRATPKVEHVTEDSYARTLNIGKQSGWVRAYKSRDKETITIELSSSLAAVLPMVLQRIKDLLDLNADTERIEDRLGEITTTAGLRVPGACDPFELCLRAVLGQQISVKAASTLMGRIAEHYGKPVECSIPELSVLTPSSTCLSAAKQDDLCRLGLTGARAQTVINLARAEKTGSISFEDRITPQAQIKRLKNIEGIGEWTAQYVAMRALKWPDAFPHTDLGIKKALGEDNPKKILQLSEKWSPWRAYATMHLWSSLHAN